MILNRPIFLFSLIALPFIFQQCESGQHTEKQPANRVFQTIEEIRIGRLEGEDEYVFGIINHVAVGKNGVIFIADRKVPVIRMYDQDGNFIRNVGKEGRGPGEYLTFGGMRTFSDGRLAIWDQNNARVSVFNQDGDFTESHSVNSTLHAADIFEVDLNGNFYVKTVLKNTPDMPNWKFGWLKISEKGELTDTIEVPLDEEREQTFVLFAASGDAHAFIEWPFSNLSTRGHLITGRNDSYSFQINYPDSVPKKIEREYTPVNVKPEEKKQWEAWVKYYGVNNVVPDIKPPYKEILTDSQGRIWIKKYVEAIYTEQNIGPHYGPESRWWEPPTFDVFLPDGTFYGTVILPLDAKFEDAKDEFIWATIKGDFDEQYVTRFRLEEMSE